MTTKSEQQICLSEKILLVDLCIKFRDMIENKKTDAVSTRSKKEGCWQKSFVRNQSAEWFVRRLYATGVTYSSSL